MVLCSRYRDNKDIRDKDNDRQLEVPDLSCIVASRKDVSRVRPVSLNTSRWVFTKPITPKTNSRKTNKWW
jgi:hypothetical protein